jgi:hypothetical protein
MLIGTQVILSLFLMMIPPTTFRPDRLANNN